MSKRFVTMVRLLAITAAFCAASLGSARVWAVQIQDLVRIKGAETNQLVGMGLVVGLPGTGDGGKYGPAMRPLAAMIQKFIDDGTIAADLKDTKNVAIVYVTATLPGSGVREGDKVDVQIASAAGAKSLAGGRLIVTPMLPPVKGGKVFAMAQGAVTIEDAARPTTGVVKGGAQLTRDIFARYMDDQGRMTLVLNDSVATWPIANSISSLINGVAAPDGPPIAKAVDQKNVVVQIPAFERNDPSAFISQIMLSYIDPSQIGTGARVVINEKTSTIIITGDVQISPVLISHKGLTITTITPKPVPTQLNPQTETTDFVGIDPDKRGGAKLADLMNAFNQLKVDAADRIAIVKELHRSGKLHAQLIME